LTVGTGGYRVIAPVASEDRGITAQSAIQDVITATARECIDPIAAGDRIGIGGTNQRDSRRIAAVGDRPTRGAGCRTDVDIKTAGRNRRRTRIAGRCGRSPGCRSCGIRCCTCRNIDDINTVTQVRDRVGP
jgi:hypothetical protein